MSDEITLQELIEKVKSDLFAPYTDTPYESKSIYPIFFINSVELEVAVNVQQSLDGGIKVTVPQFIEGKASTGTLSSSAHKMKIQLAPILSEEELRSQLDERTMKGVKEASILAIRRGIQPAGPEE